MALRLRRLAQRYQCSIAFAGLTDSTAVGRIVFAKGFSVTFHVLSLFASHSSEDVKTFSRTLIVFARVQQFSGEFAHHWLLPIATCTHFALLNAFLR